MVQSKLISSITNHKKAEIWLEITAEVNVISVHVRSFEVLEKWKSRLVRCRFCAAKKEFSSFKKDEEN